MGNQTPSDWISTWASYPCEGEFGQVPIAWVLEREDGSISGTFSNVHILCEAAGRKLRVAAGCDWAVEPDSRGMSLRLLDSFLRQPGVDICVVGSASPVTAEILGRLKVPRIPAPGYDSPMLWAVGPRLFAGAVLRRRSIRGASVLAWPAGVALGIGDFARGSGWGRPSAPTQAISGFDGRFEVFWDRLRVGRKLLRSVRTRSALAWRFQSALKAGNATVIVSCPGGELAGYAVVLRRFAPELGMDIYDIADLQAVGESPVIYRDLLLGSLRAARKGGAGALKLLTGDTAKRAAAASLKPHSYQLPFWQMFYKTTDPELAEWLAKPDSWDFSPYDNF